ncbi:MAG: 30S ribosomal protein S20 [Deltaproteobacteria bacterium]|nr:30S ribosomal protein S20 [Deltaproteobacteria bacterium]
MANHPSALKRARQSKTRKLRNLAHKTRAKSVVKEVRALLESNDTAQAREKLKKAVSTLHRSVSKGVLHRKKASRKISRLARAVNRAVLAKPA